MRSGWQSTAPSWPRTCLVASSSWEQLSRNMTKTLFTSWWVRDDCLYKCAIEQKRDKYRKTNSTCDAPVSGVWGSAFSILFNRVLGVKDTAGGSTMEEELGKSVIVIFDWSKTFTLFSSLLLYLCIKMNTTNATDHSWRIMRPIERHKMEFFCNHQNYCYYSGKTIAYSQLIHYIFSFSRNLVDQNKTMHQNEYY